MFNLEPLPYNRDALEPFMSLETLDYHYGRHHAGYVKKLNELLVGTPYENGYSLEEIVRHSDGPVFNNAAQVWNHNFFWKSLIPNGPGNPEAELKEAISHSFGSFEHFKEIFQKQAVSLFGSGWVWLVTNPEGHLVVLPMQNADNPLLIEGAIPLLACDVWEHAYYIDKRNDRAAYLQEFWDLVNWDFVGGNYKNRRMKIVDKP